MRDVWDFDEKGYRARMIHRPRDSNPYIKGTEEYHLWDTGWDEADVDERILEIEESAITPRDKHFWIVVVMLLIALLGVIYW